MTSQVDYNELIPNNVGLGSDRRLKRALERWHPQFIKWWDAYGPEHDPNKEVYLRTAVSVDKNGWAHYDYVKLPEYRWGVFLAENDRTDKTITFGDHQGDPVWSEVPGEYRGPLRRLIVTQGDTEPASVEQQRWLSATAPSLFDMRSLLQINVEEARHLWAMVYLLVAYFGRDGRQEAEDLLKRRSGDTDRPRILEAFNEPTPDWLSFFFFTFFTDRDGKYQLASLAESAFDPLARTCRFMLAEEAHHMYVGETGVSRVVQRACEVMRDKKTDDVRKHGAIDLPTMQKYINFHFSVSTDLFGGERSTNAANYFTQSLKGRYRESHITDDHRLKSDKYLVTEIENGRIRMVETPALLSINERLRDDYIADCQRGVDRWNKVIAAHNIDFELKLPHRGFNRRIGQFGSVSVTPTGDVIDDETWERNRVQWLPDVEDQEYVSSLMQPVTGCGEFAQWIASPRVGVNSQAIEFPYVRI